MIHGDICIEAASCHPGLPVRGCRYGDTSPFYSGTEIGLKSVSTGSVLSRCTSGWPWLVNGAYPLITAGHCMPTDLSRRYVYTNRNN